MCKKIIILNFQTITYLHVTSSKNYSSHRKQPYINTLNTDVMSDEFSTKKYFIFKFKPIPESFFME